MAIHIVRRGESLWSIAQKYGTSIQTIVGINGLVSEAKIVPGLALYLPDDELFIRIYIIKAGDTLWRIASRFNTTVQRIIQENPGVDPIRLLIGQKIRIPTSNKIRIQTLGFIVPYSAQNSIINLDRVAANLTYIAVVAYSFLREGWAYRVLEDGPIVNRAKQLGVKPLLMIRNIVGDDFSAELAGIVLSNSTLRQRLINSIVNLMQQGSYEGVSVDFEFIPPPQRYDFVSFLRGLKSALGNRLLHVNVHAKTEDIPTNRIIGAYDYKAIGQVADIVGVMTMDYGYPTGPPDPVSPLWWMEQVVQYAINLINPRKLQIAFPLYGYDWKLPENLTTALSARSAQNLAISVGANIQFDQVAASPYFMYWMGTTKHVVWFEDIRSFVKKYQLADQYSLLGVTFWQLKFEFSQNWTYIERNILVLK